MRLAQNTYHRKKGIDAMSPEELRRQVLLALIQVCYDRPVDKRLDPIYAKELAKYLPDDLGRWDVLNAVRFLRKHNFIKRVAGYGWQLEYLMNEQTVKRICFEHGQTLPCDKCIKREK